MLANHRSTDTDRFIPQRTYGQQCGNINASLAEIKNTAYNYSHLIRKELLFNHNDQANIFYQRQREEFQFKEEMPMESLKKINSHIESPVKVLDAPKYRDDFYLNNIDWSKEGHLGIALDNQVFLYSPQNVKEIGKSHFNSYISGIKIEQGMIGVGQSNGIVDLYDIEKGTVIRSLKGHSGRVSALAFLNSLLITGSKDKSILVNDLREKNHVIKEFNQHKGEVCTIKIKDLNQNIFASGSADGSAIVWDLKFGKIDQMKGHKGAVKALDWCPWRNGILATGGGSHQQKQIKIWNTINSKLISSESIDSQISSLVWNQQYKSLISSNHNEICLWNLTSVKNRCKLQIRQKFKAHDRRILSLVQSSNKNYLCSIGADENLKFWKLSTENSNPFHNSQKNKAETQFYRV